MITRMRGIRLIVRLVLLVGLVTASAVPAAGKPNTQGPAAPHVRNQALVSFEPSAGKQARADLHRRAGARVLNRIPELGLELVELPPGLAVSQAVRNYSADSLVRYAEPNYLLSHYGVTPNDPHFGQQWGLRNTGQTVNSDPGTSDADIDASESGSTADAWQVNTGSQDVVVAVIDTGVQISHPDLAANVWVNPGEIPGNGVDDDGNGYVDDINGWDFAGNDNSVFDSSQKCAGSFNDDHGTHVAGILGAVANNGTGLAGVAWTVRIMPLKFLTKAGTTCGAGDTFDAVEAITYAIKMGADFINASWGSPGFSNALRQALIAAGQKGIIYSAAAGNDGANLALSPGYPAAYGLENGIVVAASNNDDGLASFSNFGGPTDLAAPGANIASTYPENAYAFLSGTSMAAPFVAGSLAVLRSQYPNDPGSELKARLLETVDQKLAFTSPVTGSGGRLNLNNAIRQSRPSIPTLLSPNGGEVISPGASSSINWENHQPPGSSSGGYRAESNSLADASTITFHDFEAGVPSDFHHPANSDSPWGTATTSPPPDSRGTRSIRSGAVAADKGSWISTTRTFSVPGAVSFWYRVSSENCETPSEPVCGDYFRFYIDGLPVIEKAGVVAWTHASFQVNAGTHQLSWAYQKDPLIVENEDAAWVDDVLISGIGSSTWSLVGTTGPGATSLGWTAPSTKTASAKVRVCPDTGQPCAPRSSDSSDGPFVIGGGARLSETAGSTHVIEGSSSDSYSIVLASRPASNVTVNINPGSQVTVSPGSVVFTSTNWSTPQTITVTAVEDGTVEPLVHLATLTHQVTSTDSNFNASLLKSLTVSVSDKEKSPPPSPTPPSPSPPADQTGGWEPLGGSLGGGPDASSWSSNRLDVFARGADNSLIHSWWDGAAWRSESLGGQLTSDPAAVSWGPNRLDIFVRGTDNGMWQIFWDGTRWSGWTGHGGVLNSSPDVASWAPGRLDVFVRGSDNALWQKFWNGSSWSGWNFLGGQLTADPTAVSWGTGRIDVFVRGTDNGMWQLFWDGTRWNGWVGHGGVLVGGADAASWGPGRLDIFVRGTDSRLWYRSWTGSSWTGWQSPGGAGFLSDPGAVSWGPGRIDVFARSQQGQLLHKWFDGAWRP